MPPLLPPRAHRESTARQNPAFFPARDTRRARSPIRSEEHTSELQSQSNLVCRLLLEKKKTHHNTSTCNNYNPTTPVSYVSGNSNCSPSPSDPTISTYRALGTLTPPPRSRSTTRLGAM